MKKLNLIICLLIGITILSCSSDDDSNSQTESSETEFYEITLKLQGIQGAGYNTRLRINTFHKNSAQLQTVYETQGEIEWNNGVIEHTFTVNAKTALEIPLTEITCSTQTTLYQEYEYAIDGFDFKVIIIDDKGSIVTEQSSKEDTIDGWLQFTAIINLEIEQ